MRQFPEGFLWGAATAAHQVEGNQHNDWSEFERRPGVIAGQDRSGPGVDHWRRFPEDFGLAKAMGHNAHRLSLEWSRLEPSRGVYDPAAVAHYHEVLTTLRQLGLEPFVTLHHFTSPLWIRDQGGWASRQTVVDFARFAAFAAREFGGLVRYWLTVNEPNVYTWHGYMAGIWPPGLRNPLRAWQAMDNLSRGHAAAYRAMKPLGDFQVGIAHSLVVVEPYNPASMLDRAFSRLADREYNRRFLERAIVRDGALDFVGINYYMRSHCRFPEVVMGAHTDERNDLGWGIHPDGLRQVIMLASEYAGPAGLPIYITENGMDDRSGERRASFLVRHVEAMHRAIEEGADVRGYFHWSLVDNFEWAEGYAPRFGLYRVDRDAVMARVETPAVEPFRRICEANAIPEDLLTLASPVNP